LVSLDYLSEVIITWSRRKPRVMAQNWPLWRLLLALSGTYWSSQHGSDLATLEAAAGFEWQHGSYLATLEAAAGFKWHLLKQSAWLRSGHSIGCCWLRVALTEAVIVAQNWPLYRLLLASSGTYWSSHCGSELATLEAAAGFEWRLLKQSAWLRTSHSPGCCWLRVALTDAVSMAQMWPLWRLLLASSGTYWISQRGSDQECWREWWWDRYESLHIWQKLLTLEMGSADLLNRRMHSVEICLLCIYVCSIVGRTVHLCHRRQSLLQSCRTTVTVGSQSLSDFITSASLTRATTPAASNFQSFLSFYVLFLGFIIVMMIMWQLVRYRNTSAGIWHA